MLFERLIYVEQVPGELTVGVGRLIKCNKIHRQDDSLSDKPFRQELFPPIRIHNVGREVRSGAILVKCSLLPNSTKCKKT